jgi:hypothetical protein
VIVRIATEGQYDLGEADVAGLDALDNEAVSVCEAGNEAAFRETFGRLLDYVRSHGRPLRDDQLTGSDIILPPPDATLAEAQSEFHGEGLLPG